MEAYKLAGFIVNPKKTFCATDQDEFLRKVVSSERVTGPPARAVPLWRDPWKDEPPVGVARATELLRRWKKLSERGCDVERVLHWATVDIARAHSAKTEDVRLWIHTPASVGGGGVYPWAKDWRVFVTAPVIENSDVAVVGESLLSSWVEQDGVQTSFVSGGGLSDEKEKNNKKTTKIGRRLLNEYVSARTVEVGRGEFLGFVPVPAYTETLELEQPVRSSGNVGDRWHPTSSRLLFEQLVLDKDWGRIDELVPPGISVDALRVRHRLGRGRWLDWLRGKSVFRMPCIMTHGDEQVSVVFSECSDRAFGALLRRRTNWKKRRQEVKRFAEKENPLGYSVSADTQRLYSDPWFLGATLAAELVTVRVCALEPPIAS
jgi:hypothetical protein